MLKGAIFDQDGLMFDTEKVWQKNWKEVADEMGITLDPAFTGRICGTSGQLMLDVIQEFYHVEDGSAIQKRVSEGVLADEAVSLDQKEGLMDIIEMFHRHGVRMAVASSSPKDMILRNLKNAGIEKYFDAVVSGHEVAHGKPAPDIFQEAARQIGLKNEECYVFEDAFNGVKAGNASGSKTIMIPDLIQPTEEIRALAADVCTSLLEASQKIESGNL